VLAIASKAKLAVGSYQLAVKSKSIACAAIMRFSGFFVFN